MVPRKLMVAAVAAFLSMLIMTASSIQWANYIDRRSNQRWCELVVLFNTEYRENPPTTVLGKQIAAAMLVLQDDFSCKSE